MGIRWRDAVAAALAAVTMMIAATPVACAQAGSTAPSPPPASAAVSVPATGVNGWQIQRFDGQCWLLRTFGSGDTMVALGVVPSLLTLDGASIAMLTPSAAMGRVDAPARIVIDGTPIADATFEAWGVAQPRVRVVEVSSNHLHASALRDAHRIQVEADGARLGLDFRSFAAAWPQVEQCVAQQRRELGIDPALLLRSNEEADQRVIPAHGNPGYWLTADDYPADAMAADQQGSVSMMWRIGSDGRVHDCHIIHSSGAASLDTASCAAITRRGRYRPAHDIAGQPVDSYGMRRVFWVLPG